LVTSKDKLFATPLAMLKAPFKVALLVLIMSMLKDSGSPEVLVQLMALDVLKTQYSEEEGDWIENVAKA